MMMRFLHKTIYLHSKSFLSSIQNSKIMIFT